MPTIMEVTVQGRLFNQQTLNVFNYLYTGSETDPGGLSVSLLNSLGWPLWDAVEEDYPNSSVALAWRNLVSTAFKFEIVTVRNVYSRSDFEEWLFPFGGLSAEGKDTGEPASPMLAYGLRSSKVYTDIKRGARRIAGVQEGRMQTGGDLTSAGLIALNALGVAFSDRFDVFTAEFQPAICAKEKLPVLNPDGTPTGRFKYEYFFDPAAQVEKTAAPVSWAGVATVRSQTSRQYGRGR